MKEKTIGFIGGGRITRILLEGWTRLGKLPMHITVSDCNRDPLDRIKSQLPGIKTVTGNNPAAAAQDIVFLAVHPPVMAAVAAEIKTTLNPKALLVSLAPKFTLTKLSGLLGGFQRLARMIPNAPSLIGKGYNPICFSEALAPADRIVITQLLKPLGKCPEVAEEKLEAYALLTGMGPTYLWFQLETLREIARGFGLSEAEISLALHEMVCGSTHTLLDSGLSPGNVMDLVPLKPLGEEEAAIRKAYQTRLPALFEKIKP